MLVAIQLNRQLCRMAIEVKDIVIDDMLPAKLCIVQLSIT